MFSSSDARSGLVEDGALGVLEDDVVARIAFVHLALDFAVQVVVFVLGLPVAVGKVEGVEESAVYDVSSCCGHGSFNAEFGDESEFEFASAGGEQVLKGAADGHLVVDVELAELVESGVVVLDGGVGRLEVKLGHRS